MKSSEWIYRQVVLPLGEYATRRHVRLSWRELQNTEHLSQASVREQQQQKLDALIQHAIGYVPYYRNRLAGVTTPANLGTLPILEREDIIEHRVSLCSPITALVPNSTGGSTGAPISFFHDWRSRDFQSAGVLQTKLWLGISPGERTASLWGASFDVKPMQNWNNRIKAFLTRYQVLLAYELDKPTSIRYWQQLSYFRPALLTTYPSAIMSWLYHLRAAHLGPLPRLRAIITSAETLYDYQRTEIESFFRVPVYNRYGGREFATVAQECKCRNGLHVLESHLIVEIVREDGSPADVNEVGDLLITDLENYGFPFIRYRVGDRAAWMPDEPCKCGVPYRRLAVIEGRSFDRVWTPNGRILPGTFWTLLVRSVPGVREFQVVQNQDASLTLSIVPTAEWHESYGITLLERIQEYGGQGWSVSLIVVADIPRTRSGKLRFIVSELEKPSH